MLLLHRKSIHFGEATTLVSFESILDSEFNYYLVDFFCFMFGIFRLAFEIFLKLPACRKFGVLRLTFENFLTTSLRKLILITVQDHLVVRMLGYKLLAGPRIDME